jgi:hypothetical protein
MEGREVTTQQEQRLAQVAQLAKKYPQPIGEQILGTMVGYENPDAPHGYQGCVITFIGGQRMTICHAESLERAEQKARDYWALSESWHTPKIDKRRTTDPMARLAKALDTLADRLLPETK